MQFDYLDYDENPRGDPRHDFIQEVRNLFRMSLVADVTVHEHADECRFNRGERPCVCPTAPLYYIGRRSQPEYGLERLSVTPTFFTLGELEVYCEMNISHLRARAKSEQM